MSCAIKKTLRRILLTLILLSVAVLIIYALFLGNIFLITQISCQRDGSVCAPDIMAEINNYDQKNILLVNTGKIKGKLLSADSTIQEINIGVHLPNSLSIQISSRIPAVKITNHFSSSNYILADKDGIVLELIALDKYPDLPVLVWKDVPKYQIDKEFPQEIKNAINLVSSFKDYNLLFLSAQIERSDLIIILSDQTKVLFSLSQSNSKEQSNKLQLVLEKIKIDNIKYHTIDLRYMNPILTE